MLNESVYEWPDDVKAMLSDPNLRAGHIFHHLCVSGKSSIENLPYMVKALSHDIDHFTEELDEVPGQLDYAKCMYGDLKREWWENSEAIKTGNPACLKWYEFICNNLIKSIIDDSDLMRSGKTMEDANGKIVNGKAYDGCWVFRCGAFRFYVRIHKSEKDKVQSLSPKIIKIIKKYYKLSGNTSLMTKIINANELASELNKLFYEHLRFRVLDLIVDEEQNIVLYQAGYRATLRAAMRGRWTEDTVPYSRSQKSKNLFHKQASSSELTARETLLKLLGPIKYEDCIKKGYLTVRAKSGKIYILEPGHSMITVCENNKRLGSICIQLDGKWPETDSLIMRYLLLINDEDNLYQIGNWNDSNVGILADIDKIQSEKTRILETAPLSEILKNLKKQAVSA